MKNSLSLSLVFLLLSVIGARADVTRPPNDWGKPQKFEVVAPYGCDTNTSCEIACYPGGQERRMKGLQWAVVYKYPNSDRLWLYASGGPNAHYLIDGIFCDFTKALHTYP